MYNIAEGFKNCWWGGCSSQSSKRTLQVAYRLEAFVETRSFRIASISFGLLHMWFRDDVAKALHVIHAEGEKMMGSLSWSCWGNSKTTKDDFFLHKLREGYHSVKSRPGPWYVIEDVVNHLCSLKRNWWHERSSSEMGRALAQVKSEVLLRNVAPFDLLVGSEECRRLEDENLFEDHRSCLRCGEWVIGWALYSPLKHHNWRRTAFSMSFC